MDRGGAGVLSDDIERIREYLDRGAPWLACDAFRDARVLRPDDAELLYWGALAHARAGATSVAHALLDRCDLARLSPSLRVEALSLRGRLWKDAFQRARGLDASRLLALARAEYLQAHAIAHDPYPGINAASLAMLAGDRDAAVALARHVARALPRSCDAVWDLATRAEAHLLVGDLDAAARDYIETCARADDQAGVVASMRRQLALLSRALPSAAELLPLLPVSDVVAFAGHLIDAPGRDRPRFPPSLVPAVRTALVARIAALRAPVVFSSAACGADLLFIEAALARRAEVNVVLPFARDDFVRSSVAIAGDEWVSRFDDALERATRIIMATDEKHLGDDVLYANAAQLLEGLSRLRAAQLETSPSMLCVIDLTAPGDATGTRGSYERWKASGERLDVVDLAALASTFDPGPDPASDSGIRSSGHVSAKGGSDHVRASGGRAWKSLMFADVAGFSRVQDAFAPHFHERFLELGARAIAHSRAPPLDAKTWGDALFAVFDSAHDAADFALRFLDSARDGDWTETGIAGTAGIRVALHAGPVFSGFDPVMQRDDFFGASVTRAARIEPVTPTGTVYASEAFAAMLASEAHDAFVLEYIGRLPLAKAYGESRIYRVERG
ncbi:MAG TPA: adenylate/guanylate cyclase domain-containing protein [Casimicrobiaceae bacterium]|nr:adenylate/guanylate cyclase domain-containing protein [Casimicrobiaceae bacterium]